MALLLTTLLGYAASCPEWSPVSTTGTTPSPTVTCSGGHCNITYYTNVGDHHVLRIFKDTDNCNCIRMWTGDVTFTPSLENDDVMKDFVEIRNDSYRSYWYEILMVPPELLDVHPCDFNSTGFTFNFTGPTTGPLSVTVTPTDNTTGDMPTNITDDSTSSGCITTPASTTVLIVAAVCILICAGLRTLDANICNI